MADRKLSRLLVKYWWQLILALGIPLGSAVALEAYFGYRSQLAQIMRAQSVLAVSVASAVNANLQLETRYVSRLYRVAWQQDGLDRLAEELEIAMSILPSILQVEVNGVGGKLLFVSQLEARRLGKETAASLQPPKAAVSPVRFRTSLLGERQLPVILVEIPHGRREGEVLEMALDLRGISDLLEQAARRDGASVYVVGQDGKVLADSERVAALGQVDASGLAHVAAARLEPVRARGGFTVESVDRSGRGVLATVQSVPDSEWLVVVERPLEAAMASIRAEAQRTLLFLAVGLGVSLMLGAILARRFTQPILALGRDVERIGRGELAHRTAIRTGDEIESLGGQVNDMAARLEEYTPGLEQKVAEQTTELRAALATANEAMRARSVFLAAASHDLRQPLYAISILSDALAGASLPPESRAILDKQRQAIAVLRTLFDNLLDLSRLDAGEVRPNLRAVSLREALAPLAAEYQALALSKGLGWRDDIEEAWVQTDAELLHRVAANLLSNAVRYTERGHVAFTSRIAGGRAVIKVADTGIGIAPQDQARVFEEFVQLQNDARDRERGVGLGLSIVRKIGLLLDMRIELASVPGQGTQVTFSVPLSVSAPLEREAGAPEGDSGDIAGRRIWIVEDDAMVRDALGVQLDAWGVDHDFALTRADLEALHEADGGWPDAAMLDDMLGREEGGLELAGWLAGRMEGARLAIVTGNVQPERLAALEASGLRILRKPLSSAQLASWLRAATAGERAP